MAKGKRQLTRKMAGGALLALCGSFAHGQGDAPAASGEAGQPATLDALRQKIDAQTRQLDALKRSLAEQEAGLREMRRALSEATMASQRGGTAATASAAAAPPAQQPQQPQQTAQAGSAGGGAAAPQPATARADVANTIFEQPGVLTPKGSMVLDPSLQYSYSSSNRIALVGYTVIPAILIGLIDIREVRRTTLTASLTGRYGLTNRLELEAKVPYVYRSDSAIGREFLEGAASSGVFDSTGKGIGDVEFTARYQLNAGGADSPYYIGSLRFKSRTGKDPFQVHTTNTVTGFTQDGVQTELPTGSGFYGLQPALTVLYPSDPAVFFGTVSYLHTFSRNNLSLNTDQGPQFEGKVAPGGIFGFNFGMGLGINERSSFSIGYDHSAVGKTLINGQAGTSVRVQLGTLLLGYSLRLNDKRTLNVSLGAGLTRDTPDLTLTVRMPITF